MNNSTPKTVSINDHIYDVVSLALSDQAVFGPRFSSGSTNESDLTLKKTATFRAGDGGCFSPRLNQLTPYLVSLGVYNDIGYIEKPYANGTVATLTLGATNAYNVVTASKYWNGCAIIAIRSATTNYIYKLDSGGSCTALTIPSTLSTGVTSISSFAEKNGVLYVCTNNTAGIHYINTSFTVTKVATGSLVYKQIFNLNSKMYAVDSDNKISEYVGSTSDMSTKTIIAQIHYDYGSDLTVLPTDTLSGVQYFGTPSGLWAFDGVRGYIVIPAPRDTNLSFQFVASGNGYILTNIGSTLCRFNGSTFEKLFTYPPNTEFKGGVNFGDKMFVLTGCSTTDYISDQKSYETTSYGYRIYCYDNSDLYLYDESRLTTANGVYSNDLSIFNGWFGPVVSQGLQYLPLGTTRNSVYITPYSWAAGNNTDPLQITFRDCHFDLPSIEKNIRGFQLIFQKAITLGASDTIKIYYRLNDSDDWTLAHTFTNASTNLYLLECDVTNIPEAKRYFFRVDIGGTNIQLVSFSVNYLVNAPLKRQWNLVLNPASNSIINPDAFDPAYIDNITNLRANNTVFTFGDLNGDQFNAIIDSFSMRYIPTYNSSSDAQECQITAVIREV